MQHLSTMLREPRVQIQLAPSRPTAEPSGASDASLEFAATGPAPQSPDASSASDDNGGPAAESFEPPDLWSEDNHSASDTGSPRLPHKLRAGDIVQVRMAPMIDDNPLGDGVLEVEDEGTLALGPIFGRVNVAGLSIAEAEDVVRAKLSQVVQDPRSADHDVAGAARLK